MTPKPGYAELSERIRLLEVSEKRLREIEEQFRLVLGVSPDQIVETLSVFKAQKASLQESTKKFHHIYDNLLDVYFETSLDGIILDVSPSVEKHSNYKRGDLVGKSIDVVFSDLAKRERLVELLSEHGSVTNYEIGLNDKDGTQYICLVNVALISDEHNKPVKFVGLFHNITERKDVEKALLESEAKFRLIFDSAPLGILHYNSEGIITACNTNFVNIIGSSVEALEGLNMRNLPDQRIVHTLNEALDGRAAQFEGEYRSITADKITPVRLLFSPIFSRKGDIDGGIGIIEDVSERIRAEAALLESEKRYKHLFDNAPAGIFEIDLLSGKFSNVNNVMCEYTGYTEEEFLSTRALDLLTDQSRDVYINEFKKLLAGEAISENTEYDVIKKDGQTLCVILNSDFIYQGGQYTRAMIVAHDITERKKIAEMMIQNEKMLSVGGLAAGMAHEINNPLAGMMQIADVMSMRLGDDTMPANLKAAAETGVDMSKVRAYMEKRGIPRMLNSMHESGVRMAEIVDNMLSFSRKSDALVSSYAIPSLLDKALELAATDFDLKKNYDFKGIAIKKDYQENLPLVVCESAKIQQVLLNVLINGAQAMQAAGGVKPELIVRIYKEESRQMVCIEISDNGPGMDAKTLKRIFEPFFTTKPVGVGTGLGLSVSYFIITENHGGEMSVDSTPGQGTTFTICLPMAGKSIL